MEDEAVQRLNAKNHDTLLLNELQTDYSLSPVEAKVLLQRMIIFREDHVAATDLIYS